MATTTGTGAKKINGTDNWREIFDDHNDTVDAYDGIIGTTSLPTTAQTLTGAVAEQNGAIAKLDESIAIVSDNNTHANIAAGQYVYVKNHGTLTEGLYTSNSAISENAALSSSNVTAVSGGGLNALNSNLTTLSSESLNRFGIPSQINSYLDCFTNGETGFSVKVIKNGATDSPFATAAYCMQMKYDGNFGWQIALAATTTKIYQRILIGGAWTNWRLLSPDIEDVTVTVNTNSSDSRYISSSIACKRSGAVVQLFIDVTADFSSTNFDNGDDLDVYLTGYPLPAMLYNYTIAFDHGNIFAVSLSNSGMLRFRNVSNTKFVSSSQHLITCITYLTND